MTSERITLRLEDISLGENLSGMLVNMGLSTSGKKKIIGIAGESGSGKSVTAQALKKALESRGMRASVLSMDHYFILPPKKNHDAREKDIRHVGLQEVNLDRLQNDINRFLAEEKKLQIPQTDYTHDAFTEIELETEDLDLLIIEGTYIFYLQHIDFRIFIDRNFIQTYRSRVERMRDIMTPFIEDVLAIEHHLIRHTRNLSHIIVDGNYHASWYQGEG